ncbi:MAG: helix-turn-helix transcriptional regulator [Altererythrobacter sp.]|nr:AraC family transcriptional regulator [Altererythrobacter sp.]NNK46934.1 helix-turn-helix transcriptional regulator [Altererythrobacter sp.]
MADYDNRFGDQTAMRSRFGMTEAGEPLSLNRAPCEELAPWVARLFVVDVDAPDDHVVDCGLCADTPILRVLLRGRWTAQTRYGTGRYEKAAVYFGPQTQLMPVKVHGGFSTLGVALRPGAVAALKGPDVADTLDRIIYYDDIFGDRAWGTSEQLIEWFDPDGAPERWLRVAEKLLLQLVELAGGKKPNPIIEAFDKAAFADPNMNLAEFAEENAVERRRLERLVKKAYGQTPKQVLRRARALDVASNLIGVADDAEAAEIALRYYDQSHLIREFSNFFNNTPKRFAKNKHPLLAIALEARQARRMEVLGRVDPGDDLPWRKRGQD